MMFSHPGFRRPVLRGLWFLALLCCVGVPARPVAAAKPLPNVVMIVGDDQAWGDYGFMGHPHIRTPHLDRLAAEGLTFTRGYVPDSLCRPSLATIISGLYPHQHGIVGNDPPRPASMLGGDGRGHVHPDYLPIRQRYIDKIDAVETLADMLAPLGYTSFQSGKWWEGHYSRGGFDAGMTHGDLARGGRHGDVGLRIGREGLAPIEQFLDVARTDAQPFFLWYAPMMPHTPHNPPQRFLTKYRDKTESLSIAKYWAMCEWFDETCGQLLGELEHRGLSENTIVVYVADNGWITDAHESAYAPRSKRSPNEGGTRTPIIVHWPGHIPARRDQQHLASSIDLVPTILAQLQQPIPPELPGIDLDDPEAVENRQAIYGEIFEHDIVSMDDSAASLRYRWVIEGQWKLIEPNKARVPDAVSELYHLGNDPAEQRNMAAADPERAKHLRQRLNEWWSPLRKALRRAGG